MAQEIYELSEAEMEIISASLNDPNIFFDYFFRKPGKEVGWQLDYGFTEKGKWQKKMCMATQSFIVAHTGIACASIDSRVYDAELKRYISFEELLVIKRAPVVLARDINGWKQVKATLPFFKGRALAKRVTFSDGNSVKVSLDHRFLVANRGFVRTQDLLTGDALVAPRKPSESVPNAFEILPDSYCSSCNGGWDYYTPIVTNIEDIGEIDLYDIHVPDYENYVMEGVVSHNTGKTLGTVMSASYHAVTTPGFKFLNVAKEAWQSMLMYKALLEQAEGTIFDKMIVERPRSPYPMVKIAYRIGDRVIASTLEYMSLGESGQGDNIFSWRGDWINIEEAGRIDNLAQLVTMLVTRLTGVTADGRSFLGRLSLISNPRENIDLWNLYSMAESDEKDGLVFSIDTAENKNVSQKQLDMQMKLIPEDQRARFLSGKRPRGRGTYFPEKIVDMGESQVLSQSILDGIAQGLPGYEMEILPNNGVWSYRIPRKDGRTYFVLGDPGVGAAPARNAPTILVFDVTDAPRVCPIVCMWWGNGYGLISPFIAKMVELIQHYAPMLAGIDNTATQKNTAELINLEYIEGKGYSVGQIRGLDFSGGRKSTYLVSAKLALESNSITWASMATAISAQLRNYDPANDKTNSRLPQDLVATLAMGSFAIRLYFGFNENATGAFSAANGGNDEGLVRNDRTGEPSGRTPRTFERNPWSVQRQNRSERAINL